MTFNHNSAVLCSKIYSPLQGDFDAIYSNAAVTVGVKSVDGYLTLVFRGSADKTDFINDFEAIPYLHPRFGNIHVGMWHGCQDMFFTLLPILRKASAIRMTGHSLGGAHAAFMAGQCALANIPVVSLSLFEPPRCSYQTFVDFLHKWVPNILATCNGLDPVPLVPLTLADYPFVPIAPYTYLNAIPQGWEMINPIDYHSIDLVITAL